MYCFYQFSFNVFVSNYRLDEAYLQIFIGAPVPVSIKPLLLIKISLSVGDVRIFVLFILGIFIVNIVKRPTDTTKRILKAIIKIIWMFSKLRKFDRISRPL